MLWVKAVRPQKCMVLVFVNTCEHACHFERGILLSDFCVVRGAVCLTDPHLWWQMHHCGPS